MRIGIVEDELLIAEMLKVMLQDLGHEVAALVDNYDEAKIFLEKQNLDLVFLDINLRTVNNGFDIARLINETSKIPFLFLTSYSDKQTITEAMIYQPQAYLIKPFSEIDLFTTLELVKSKKIKKIADQNLIIKDGTANIKINLKDIIYLKSDNIYVTIKTEIKSYLVRTSLNKILEEISNSEITRVHRTYAVNVQLVQAVSSNFVMVAGEKIPLSRIHRNELNEKYRQ